MSVDELLDLPLVDMATMLRDRRLDAVALTETCLGRIATANDEINAILHVDPAGALAAARDSDRRHARGCPAGPLDGLPLVVKDNIEMVDLPMTNGMGVVHQSLRDAAVVARLRAGGAVLLGKANMDEAALGAEGRNPHHGGVENPNQRGFSVGGSSSGSAAAVAAGFCPAALGTDTLGSVRLPAAYCGLAGFKPSHELIPAKGVVPVLPEFDVVGPIARSVADVTYLMSGLVDRRTSLKKKTVGQFRWGVPAELVDEPIMPAVRVAFEQVVSRLTDVFSFRVSVHLPRWAPGPVRRAGLLLAERGVTQHWPRWLQAADNATSKHLQSMLEFGQDATSDRVQAARELVEQSAQDLVGVFETVDIVVMPTTPQTTFALDGPGPANQADYTALANFAGCPAISLPCPVSADQRPVGLQLIGAPGSDELLLSRALSVEEQIGRCHDH